MRSGYPIIYYAASSNNKEMFDLLLNKNIDDIDSSIFEKFINEEFMDEEMTDDKQYYLDKINIKLL